MADTVATASSYAEARREWLADLSHSDLFSLAQLLVSTIDIDAKTAPRTIRGLSLNKHERELCDSFRQHMRFFVSRQQRWNIAWELLDVNPPFIEGLSDAD